MCLSVLSQHALLRILGTFTSQDHILGCWAAALWEALRLRCGWVCCWLLWRGRLWTPQEGACIFGIFSSEWPLDHLVKFCSSLTGIWLGLHWLSGWTGENWHFMYCFSLSSASFPPCIGVFFRKSIETYGFLNGRLLYFLLVYFSSLGIL